MPSNTGEHMTGKARNFLHKGNYSQAMRSARGALAVDPNNKEAREILKAAEAALRTASGDFLEGYSDRKSPYSNSATDPRESIYELNVSIIEILAQRGLKKLLIWIGLLILTAYLSTGWFYIFSTAFLLWCIGLVIEKINFDLIISTERIEFEYGFFSKQRIVVELKSIKDVQLTQSMLQSKLDTGTLSVFFELATTRNLKLSIRSPHAIQARLLKSIPDIEDQTSHW